MDYSDVAPEIEEKLRTICLALPDAYEEKAWAGSRWLIRRRNFAFCLGVDDRVVVVFRSAPPELDALVHAGHPFFGMGDGKNVVGMVIDDETDWEELAELLSDSYCIMAPKKLAALVAGGDTPRQ
ncbi:MAG: hypothetical protein QOI61_2625 [Actinomycetota bacterium]|jgi:hypothetical protein